MIFCDAVAALTLGFDPVLLPDHFQWHGADFAVGSKEEYENLADTFLGGPKAPTAEECNRLGGDVVRYDPMTEEFGVLGTDGVIRTYYKPVPCHTLPPAKRVRPDGRKNCHGLRTNREYFKRTCETW